MAGASLLTLIDDIASLLDDIATMTKVASKKTAGVLGDDLALNAQQVSGVNADRELPVVWAVAKGSLVNKAILVPAALLISAFVPMLIIPLLMLGGAFLCFEGAEKLLESLSGKHHDDEAATSPITDLAVHEKNKVKGAIRTDFILSAEIIVISLGTVAHATLTEQLAVLVVVALIMTVGVYGLVAGIVKLDDAGLYLLRKGEQGESRLSQAVGKGLLLFAPFLMKSLAVLGTAAMFLVGGGIISHGIPWLHHLNERAGKSLAAWGGDVVAWLAPVLFNGVLGVLTGAVLVAFIHAIQAWRAKG